MVEKLKTTLKKYPKLDFNKVIKKINNYQYVSFDIFDTLVKRDVKSPSFVFCLIEEYYNKVYSNNIKNFKNDRMIAEKKARRKNTREITIYDIYNELKNFKNYNQDIINRLIEIEYEMEIKVSVENKKIKKIYNWCLENNKKVIFTSDMYLPKEVIVNILNKCGYTVYNNLFLSSEIGFKKSDKKLYKFILNDLNISQKQIIHIGNSFIKDYIKAKKSGLTAILIPTSINNITKKANKKYGISNHLNKEFYSFINNRIDESWDEYYKFGYESFGILLYGFCEWLHSELQKNKIERVFFFSRDGFIIKKAFDILYSNDSSIETKYLYVSRRSVRVPQLWLSPDFSSIIDSLPISNMITLKSFFKNIGLDINNYEKTIEKYNFEANHIFMKKNMINDEKLRLLYKEIQEDMIKNSKLEFDWIVQYFQENNLKNKIAVVDIGKRGGIQLFIEKIALAANIDLDINGYYVGLISNRIKNIKSKGYVYDINSLTKSCDSWNAFDGLVESLFLAQEGSTYKYKKDNNKITPLLYDYEYDKNGDINKVNSIQKGAIDFIKNIKESIYFGISIPSYNAFNNIYLTGIKPNKKDLKMFSKIKFLENDVTYLANPKKILYYIFHLKQLKIDLYNSRWKIGFMKKLLKVPLPYIKIYNFLKKMN